MPHDESPSEQGAFDRRGLRESEGCRPKRQCVAEIRTPRGARVVGPFNGFTEVQWFAGCLVGGENLIVLRKLVQPDEFGV